VVRDEALHAAVLAAPDDDGPRLVYADWLMDRGDPRGEYIAVSIACERAPTPELEARRSELWTKHRATWEPKTRVTFRRGFIERVWVRPEDVDTLDDVLAGACVRELHVSMQGRHNLLPAITPRLERMRLREIEVHWGLVEPVSFAAFVASPSLRALEALSINSATLESGVLDLLAEAETLTNVRWLDLGHNGIGPNTIARVVATKLRGVTRLVLRANALREADVEALLALGLPLQRLDLALNSIGAAGARAIARAPQSAHLTSLGLADAGIGAEGIDALIDSPYLRRGMRLALDGDILGLDTRGSRWVGEISKRLTDRFEVDIDGEPPY
jgi:uncharacterized protein (TIGR02996 family)